MRVNEKTILVAEDEEDIRLLLRAVLEAEGYRVIEATTGRSAVSIAGDIRPQLILMDISLPLLDGLSATRQIKAEEALRDVPIVAISAYHAARRRAIQAGCADLIGKPLDFEELKRVVRQLTDVEQRH
ncbi:MAG TPA: response regulator [Pyrinomonadaceae bacterium]|jgi:CheY-like chemotaxis protein|nr:response regulator [Pyrinomonadaceae bacterium]